MFQVILKKLREEKGLSQAKFAEQIGVSQSTVGMWESGKNKPEYATLLKISDFFDMSIDTLTKSGITFSEKASSKGVKIPVLGCVQAGIPIEAIEDILDYEEISADMASHGEYFALQIRGKSMEPKMSEGDVVIVRRQPDVENGEIAIVLVNGDDATVKKVRKSNAGIMLIPTNNAFEPMFYSNEEIQELPVVILGKVVELRAKF